jgi:uncharacterized protein with HEPN domain
MRPERTLKTLEDIRDAAAFILEATGGKTGDDYRRNRLLRQAIERNFEVIGEAMGRLVREDPVTVGRIAEHERIIAFRNILIHGYDLVDDELVWDTIQSKVPCCWPRSKGFSRTNHHDGRSLLRLSSEERALDKTIAEVGERYRYRQYGDGVAAANDAQITASLCSGNQGLSSKSR